MTSSYHLVLHSSRASFECPAGVSVEYTTNSGPQRGLWLLPWWCCYLIAKSRLTLL